MTESTEAPSVITRYLQAADAKDPQALAACFTSDGTVLDEGATHTGYDEIVAWREQTIGQWTYTSEVLSTEAVGAQEYRALVHIEGNFPGGQADLKYRFLLDGDLISALSIIE